MNNLSPLGLITCFIFSMVLTGASVDHPATSFAMEPYITNLCSDTIYFKPESRKTNPGLDPNGAYALAPGESYFLPFDAIVTPATGHGKMYRLPTGSRVFVAKDGTPRPANLIGNAGTLLPSYGYVGSPCVNFAKLVNPKGVLIQEGDIVAPHVSGLLLAATAYE